MRGTRANATKTVATCLGGCRHAEPKRKQRTHVGDILQAFEQRDKMQQIVVCWVAYPAFDGDSIVWM
jgi:hypothetical protein